MQSLRHIIVPQALRAATPALVSRGILQFKNTSLAMTVGISELSYQALELKNETYRTFAVFGVATAFYLAGSLLVIFVGERIAARYAVSK